MTNPASPGGDERPPPARETTERFEPTPAFDALAAEVPLAEPIGGGASTLAPEADYTLAPAPTDAGPLAQVKTFAAEKPAAIESTDTNTTTTPAIPTIATSDEFSRTGMVRRFKAITATV